VLIVGTEGIDASCMGGQWLSLWDSLFTAVPEHLLWPPVHYHVKLKLVKLTFLQVTVLLLLTCLKWLQLTLFLALTVV
jgi:hypothetical protein